MKNIKRVLSITLILSFVVVLVLTFTSCNAFKKKVASVEFSVDGTRLTANYVENLKLSAVAKDKNGNIIENAKIEFYDGENILAYPNFRTREVGFHELYALSDGVKSEKVKILASNGSIFSLNISTDKFSIKNDGTDCVTFTAQALDSKDEPVSDPIVSYYINDEIFKGTKFTAKEEGIFLLKAITGSIESNVVAISSKSAPSATIQLSVSNSVLFTDKQNEAEITYVVKDLEGNTINDAKVDLFDNGTKIEGNKVSYSETGLHSIYAVYDGNVSNTETIKVRTPINRVYNGPESDLPVIVIDTNGELINADGKIPGTMYVFDKETNKPGDTPDIVTPIEVKYRGQSSLTFPKKQYSVTTVDIDGNNNNIPLLGLPEENDWILNGSYADKSLLRNYTAYEIFKETQPYTSETRFCEVYVNETNDIDNPYNYMGILSLIEKIKIDKNRVDIEKLNPEDISGENLTGGYIVAQDKVKEGEEKINAKADFTYVSPSYENMTPEQIDYISTYVKDFSRSLFSNDYLNPNTGYKSYLDIESYANSLVVTEFFKAADGMDLSTYFYKPRGKKLISGPAWDFDLSMGNTDFRTCTEPEGWYCVSLDEYPRRIMTDPEAVTLFRNRWHELRDTTLSDDNIDRVLDEGLETIENALPRSLERWPAQWNGQFVWPNPSGDDYTYSHEDEVEKLRDFLHDRAKWIDENVDNEINLEPVWYDWINEFTHERMNPKP